MKDPDINTIDPMAQAFRRSEMDTLKKFFQTVLTQLPDTFFEQWKDAEIESFQKVVEAANRRRT